MTRNSKENEAPATPEAVARRSMLEANWRGGSDVDLTLVTNEGTRLSWLGGRVNVVAADPQHVAREQLGLRQASAGSYLIEVSRTDIDDGRPIEGEVTVKALGQTRRIPFRLTSKRTTVGRVEVTRKSRLVPSTGPRP